WMAEGYPVISGKIKRVGKPIIAYGDSESRAYDNLVMKLEKNPGKSKGKAQKAKGKSKGNPKRKGKRNLDEIGAAAKLASEFRGSPAKQVLELSEPTKFRDDYAHLGWLVQMVFQPPYDEGIADPSDLSDFYNETYER